MDKINIATIIDGLMTIDDDKDKFKWEFFKEGIEISRIYAQDNNGSACALLKYEAGAEAPLHIHTGYEHILILSGSQTDGVNVYKKGMLMISEPGSQHHIFSENGCIVLAIWQAPVEFVK